MPSKSVVVGSAVGLHARPAAIIAEAAEGLDATVTINGVDASSSLMIMTLGAGNGATVEVESDDQSALEGAACSPRARRRPRPVRSWSRGTPASRFERREPAPRTALRAGPVARCEPTWGTSWTSGGRQRQRARDQRGTVGPGPTVTKA